MEVDARTMPDRSTIDADLCIVGAGAAGLVLAAALIDSGLRVVLVESGQHTIDAETDALNDADSIGDYGELRNTRARGIGGTTHRWNTGVGGEPGAKYLPLDEIDFERRAWEWSGWPFARDYLTRYYSDAQAICGLGPFEYTAERWAGDAALLPFRDSGLHTAVYQYGTASALRDARRSLIAASTSVQLLHGATVTGLVRASDTGPVTAMRWSTLSGTTGMVTASRFVLAAGAIENARLLLLSATNARPCADWVGRGFMEHPIDHSLELHSKEPALEGDSSFYQPHPVDGAPAVMGRIALAPDLLRELQLPNASVRLQAPADPAILSRPASRGMARRLVPFRGARRVIGNVVRGISGSAGKMRGAHYRLLIDLEQLPHRDNRVVLANDVDRFGLRRAALHWNWRERDEAHRVRIRAAIARELERAGAGRTTEHPDRPIEPQAHHHAGTTRMHDDPAEGVVDANLRVHGEDGLYLLGASVFPTAGVANPTLTVVALALRLAEHLKG
jgi:choline dehydrogenase-like flavoprotein